MLAAVATAGVLLGFMLGILAAVFYVDSRTREPARPSVRETYIGRLRLVGGEGGLEYAELLELSPALPGETIEDLHDGYLRHVASLPHPETIPLSINRG